MGMVPVPSLLLLMTGPAPAEVGLDEGHQIAVEHPLDVAGLVIGAQVLGHLIGLEDIRTDLAAPGCLPLLSPYRIEMLAMLLAGLIVMLGTKLRSRRHEAVVHPPAPVSVGSNVIHQMEQLS